ncbi:MAG: four helix bundle protein [Fulvivirga sp.]
MHNLKELKISSKAINLATRVYKATENFPSEEKYALTSQIRRSAVSIASNISEGAGRNSDKEFVYFLGVANGSAYELQTQLVISAQLNLISEDIVDQILSELTEIQKMNFTFQKTLKNRRSEAVNI